MKLSDIIIAVVLFSMFITGSSIFVVDFAGVHNPNMTAYNDTYNQMGEMRATVDEIADDVNTTKTSFSDFMGVLRLPWEVAKLTFSSFGVVQTSLETFAEDYHIPTWFIYGIITMFMCAAIFAVLAVLLRRDM